MRRPRWAGLGLAVAVAAGGCAGGHISLGTNAGACFRDLPPAQDAVHDVGKLVGVRRVSAATLKARLPNDVTLQTLPDQDLCVFAFSGTYAANDITGAANTGTLNSQSGHFAIVAVGTNRPVVVAAAVVDQLPTRFRHTH